MSKFFVQAVLISAFLVASDVAFAACVTGEWITPPPSKVFKQGVLRLHFTPRYFNGTAPIDTVVLEGDQNPTTFSVKQSKTHLDIIEDWIPVGGWGDRKHIGFPRQDYYPDIPDGGTVIGFDVSDEPVPAAEKVMLILGQPVIYTYEDSRAIVHTVVDKVIEGAIYWVEVESDIYSTAQPFQLGDDRGFDINFMGARDQISTQQFCGAGFWNHQCEMIKLHVQAEDLAGVKGPVSEPVPLDLSSTVCQTSEASNSSAGGCSVTGNVESGLASGEIIFLICTFLFLLILKPWRSHW